MRWLKRHDPALILNDPTPMKDWQGVPDDALDGLTVREVERFYALVGLSMDAGYPRGYAERQALILVLEDRIRAGLAGNPS